MRYMALNNNEKKAVLLASASFIASLLFLKFSGFSVSSIVNFYNHIIKSVIFSASTDTISAVGLLLNPFVLVFASLVFLALAISVLASFGTQKSGNISGIIGGIAAVVMFSSIAGIFLAVAVFFCSFAPRFSSMYSREMKKWVKFRTGSNTAGKVLLVFNILIALGIFSSVLAYQADYEASFKNEMRDSVKALALSLPGASGMSSEMLNERVEYTTNSLTNSEFFGAYITWLPVSAAFTAWVILEFLRNLVLTNIAGLFARLMMRGRV
ncbi:MAG: hypothetical protein QT00_C0002G0271 [archaeon GW2011_AR5]|nr:MAG: hypothetical protein QT00_C0002G0271 [archaeon GW2011_AR5]